MAIPVIETFAKDSGTSSATLSCPKPTGVATGDLLVLIGCSDNTTDTPQFSDNKTGWNFEFNQGDSVNDAHIGVFWRIADGTEGDPETITGAVSDDWCMFYIRISGTDASPIHKTTRQQANASNHAVLGVTTTIDDCLVLYGLSFDGGDGFPFSVAGTGWVEKDEEQSGTVSNQSSGTWGARDLASFGASGTAAVTSSKFDGASHFQIALIPPGGATTEQAVTVTHTAAATLVKLIGLPRSVVHTSTVTLAKNIGVIKALSHVAVASLVKQMSFTKAVGHTVTASTATASIFPLLAAVGHTASVGLVKLIGLPRAVAHVATATLAKNIGVIKPVSHVTTASLVKQMGFTKAVGHIITPNVTFANLFTRLATVGHAASVGLVKLIGLPRSVTHTSTIILAKNIGVIKALSHVTTVGLVKQMGLIKAVGHIITPNVTFANLFTRLAAVGHTVSASTTQILIAVVSSVLGHTVTASLIKSIGMTRAVSHTASAGLIKLVGLPRSVAHTVSASTSTVLTFAVSAVVGAVHTAVTSAALIAAVSIVVGAVHTAATSTLFIVGVAGKLLHRRLRAWRRFF